MTHRVVVVGGGLSGAAAALAAADGGAQVTVLEWRNRFGGLTWSFQRRGLTLDNGQHVFLRCCTAYLEFLRRIGGEHQVAIQRRLDVPVLAPGGRTAAIARTGLPAPLHLLGSLLGFRHLPLTDRLLAIRAAAALRRLDPLDPSLDTVTFGAWLADHGQSALAIEHFWNLIVLPTINLPAQEASLALAAVVFRTGLLDTNDGGDIGWATVPLGTLHGENIARALADAGVEHHFGVKAQAVVPASSSRWEVVAEDRTWEADAVIVATPPQTASQLVPDVSLTSAMGLGAVPILNVHLVFDRKVTDLAMGACTDSPVQFFFDRTATSGLQHGQYLALSISAADALVGQRPASLIERFRVALGEVLPAAKTANLLDATVSIERSATFRGVPGTAVLRPGARTSLEGVALAGAWCDTGWPATMEGAVRSGVAAAHVVLETDRAPSFAQGPGTPVLEEVE